MASSKKKWGFVVVGAVAAVALGAIGVAERREQPAGVAQPIEFGPGRRPACPGLRRRRAARRLRRRRSWPRPRRRWSRHGRGARELSGKDVAPSWSSAPPGASNRSPRPRVSTPPGSWPTRWRSRQAELDAAVKAGTLTDAQRTEIEAGLQDRFQQELTETGMPGGHGGPGGPGGGHGRGLGGGPRIAEVLAELSGKDVAILRSTSPARPSRRSPRRGRRDRRAAGQGRGQEKASSTRAVKVAPHRRAASRRSSRPSGSPEGGADRGALGR